MNKSYGLVFSEISGTWIAVAEHVRARGKRSASAVLLSAASLLLSPDVLLASPTGPPPAATQLPTGGQVTAGQATINQTTSATSAVMNINQSTQRAAIGWNTFNLGSAGTINFNQPSAQSVTLNRVNDTNPSQIFGKINAPGTVWLLNPNGVYFGASSRVDVGALVATTYHMSDADFMAGKTTFSRNGALGSVVNDGELKARLDGYIALMAPEVRNQGVVVANRGTVVLASGEAITLDFDGASKLTGITVKASDIATLIENKHAIETPDGQIILSAQSANQLRQGVVRNSGSLLANSGASTITRKGGRILLEGDEISLTSTSNIEAKGELGGGVVLVGGDWQGSNGVYQAQKVTMEAGASIDASATQHGDGGKLVLWSDIHDAQSRTTVAGSLKAQGGAQGGQGGKIETSGRQLMVDGIRVDTTAAAGETGLWLLDPYNITISSGTQTGVDGTYQATANSAVVNATTLTTALNSSNVTVSTGGGGSAGSEAGDITVATAITSGSANKLTLDAYRHINLNAAITRSGAGGLELKTTTGAVAGSGAISIGAGGLTFNVGGTNSSNYTGDISGTGALIKSGTGTQTLAGRGDMTGGTTVQAGTLRLVPGSAESTNRFRWANGDHTITVNSGAVLELAATAGNGSNQTYLEAGRNLTLSGSGTVRKTGSFHLSMGWSDRRFIVNQASDGLFQVAEGQVIHDYTRDNWSTNQGVLQIDAGTTFNTYGENINISGLKGGGTLTNTYAAGGNKRIFINNTSSTADHTYSGNVDWHLWIEKAGAGKQAFSGGMTNFGDYILYGGTLELSGTNGSLNTSADIRMDAGTRLNVASNISLGSLWHVNGSPTDAVINLSNNASLTIGDGDSRTFAGVIQGQGSIAKTQGSGTQTLSGQLSYTGSTTVGSGGLSLSGTTNLPTGGDLIVNGGTLNLNNISQSVGKLSGTGGTIQLGSGTLTLNQTSNGSFAGNIRGTGGLVKNGTGTINLTNWSDYSGTTTINGGTLSLDRFDGNSGAGTLNSSRVIVNSGGILDWAVGNSFGWIASSGIEAITVNEGGQVGRADNALQQHMWNNFTVDMTGGKFYVAGNTQSMGVTFNIKAPATAGAISEILPSGSGHFALRTEGLNITFDVAENASAVVSAAIKTNNTYGTLTKSGLGQLELAGNNTYYGGTTVNAGTLRVSGTQYPTAGDASETTVATGATYIAANNHKVGYLQGGGNVQILDGVTLTADDGGSSVTYSGVMSGAGRFVKAGVGSMTLTGANTFTGGFTLENGTVWLDSATGPAIATNITLGNNTATQPNLRMMRDDQFADGLVLTSANTRGNWTRFDLRGTNQSLKQIVGGSSSTEGSLILQNRGSDNTVVTGRSQGTLTLTGNDNSILNAYVRDQDNNGTTNPLKIVKRGSGNLLFLHTTSKEDNANFTGGLDVQGGTVTVGDGSDHGRIGSAPVNLAAGTTITYHRSTNPYSINNNWSGDGTVILKGTGNNGQSSYSYYGTNTLSAAGRVVVDKARYDVTTGGTLGNAATIDVRDGGQLFFSSAVSGTFSAPILLSGGGWKEPTSGQQLGAIRHSSSNLVTLSGPITLANDARIHTSGSGHLAISGVIDDGSNTFGLEKTGYYGLTLSGANTYGGDTVIRGGRLLLNNASGPALYNGTTGTVRINNDNSTGSFSASSNFVGLQTLRDNQLGSNVSVSFDGTSYSQGYFNEFSLNGTSQTIGNLLDAGGNYRNLIQHQNTANNQTGTLTVTQTTDATFTGSIRRSWDGSNSVLNLVKEGDAKLTFKSNQTHPNHLGSGSLHVKAGELVYDIDIDSSTGQDSLGVASLRVDTGATFTYVNDTDVSLSPELLGSGMINLRGIDTSGVGAYYVNRSSSAFAGVVNLSNGARLTLSNATALGTGTLNVPSGSQVVANTPTPITTALKIAGQGWLEGAGLLGALRMNNGATWAGTIELTADADVGVYGSSESASITGVISGADTSRLWKTWNGTLTLSGLNTYAGGTGLAQGVLAVSSVANAGAASALGASTADAANLLFNGGSLRYTGSAAATSNRGFSIAAGGSATIDLPAVSLTLSGGTPATTGSLSKSGSGTLALAGASLFTGSTTVNAGDLEILPGGNLGGGAYAGAISLGNGSTLRYKAGGTQAFSGAISGTGGNLLIDGATSVVTLSGANSYTGRTDIDGGTLKITGGASRTTAIDIASGATLEFDTGSTSWTGGGNDGSLTGTQFGFWTGSAGVTWTGAGTIIKKGTGTLGISTDDADTWALLAGSKIDVQEGRIYFGWGWNDTATNNKVDVNVASGATFDLWDLPQYRIRNLTGSGTVSGASYTNATLPTLVVGESDATSTFSGNVTHLVGAITKVGSGTFTLDGAVNHGFSRSLSINAGEFKLTSSGRFNSGTLNGTVAVTSGATLRFDTSSPQTLAGVVSGSGNLIQDGAGLLTLANDNTFSGQTTVADNRQLYIGNSSGSTGSIGGDVSVGAGALLTYKSNLNHRQVSNTFSGSGQVDFTGTNTSNQGSYKFTLASPNFSGTVISKPQTRLTVNNAGAFGTGIVKVESTGQLYLVAEGAQAFGAGGLANTVYLAGDGWQESVGQLGALRIDNSALFSGNAILTANARIGVWGDTGWGTIGGVISEQGGSFALEKWGPGRMLLTGASTYTGKTYVSDGILRLANANGPALYAGAGGGEVVIGHKVNSTSWVFPNVMAQLEFGADNQLGSDVDVTFDTPYRYAYMTLRGTTQTVGNISTGQNPEWAVLQNVESAFHDSGVGPARLIFNQTKDLEYKGYLRDAWRDSAGRDSNETPTSGGTKPALALEKYGSGKLTINNGTYNTGGITIHEGTLQIGDGGSVGSLDARNTVNLTSTSSTLEYFRNNDVSINHNITGIGNVIFRGTGVSGQSHYDYNGTNSIGVDATITVDKARLRVDAQANIGTNNPWVIVKQGGQLWFPSNPTINSRIKLEGEGWLEAAATGKGVNGLGALRLDNNGTLQLNGQIVLTGNARIGMWSTNANVSIASSISETGGSYGLEYRAFNPSTTDSTASLITLTGSSSYTGYTNLISGRLRLANPSGRALYTNTATTSNISIISLVNGADAFLEFGANNQLGSNVNLVFDSRSTGWAETNIMGTSQVIGNILQGSNSNNWRANIQNHWNLDSFANGTLTIAQTQNVAFTGNVRDKAGIPGNSKLNIVKDGAGTLRLLNTTNPYFYGGSTTVNDGTLAFDFFANGSGNFSPRTSGVTLNANDAAGTRGVLEFNVGSGNTADLGYNLSVSGNGTLRKTGAGKIQWGTTAATFNLGAGSWIDVQGGEFVAGSYNNEDWSNNKASLNIATGATFSSVEENVIIDALTGGGTWRSGWSTLSSSPVIGIAGGSGSFSGVIQDQDPANNHKLKNVIKVGSGTQIFTGANTYSGVTQVQGGVLQIGDGGTTGQLGSSSSEVQLIGGSLAFNRSNAYTVSQAVTKGSDPANNTGLLVQQGSGTTTLSHATNTYNVGTKVDAGKLVFDGTSTETPTVDIASGATLTLSGNLNSFTNASGITYRGAGTLERDAPSANAVAALYGSAGGTVALSAGGWIKLLNGELRLDNLSNWANNFASLDIASTASLNFNSFTQSMRVDALTGSGPITRSGSGAGTLVIGVADHTGTGGSASYSGSIANVSGTIALSKLGSGTQTLAGIATNSGDTLISAGTLRVTGGLGDSSAVSVASGATYDARSVDTIGALSAVSGSIVTLGTGAVLTVGGLGTDTVVATSISGAGGLTKTGSGTLTLSADNSFTGATTVAGGTLAVTGTLADTTAVALSASGTVYTAGRSDTIGSLAGVAGSSVTLADGVTLSAGGTGASSTLAGVVSGNGSLVKQGSGTWTLSGANSYGGSTTVQGGMLQLGANEAIPNASLLTVASGAEFFLNGHTETVHRVAGSGRIHLASTLLIGGDNSSYTLTPEVYGTGHLVKQGSGTVTVTQSIDLGSSGGNVRIAGGMLAVGAGGSTGDLGTSSVQVDSGALLSIERSNGFTLANQSITGNGAVRIVSGGNLVLNAPVTLTLVSSAAAGDARLSVQAAGDLTLGASLSVAGSNPDAGTGAIDLRAARLVVGNGAGLTATGGRWLAWTDSPLTDAGEETLGYDFRQYAATAGSTTPAGSGNGLMYRLSPTLGTIGLATLVTKTYDGNTSSPVTADNFSGSSFDLTQSNLVNGDRPNGITLASDFTATFDTPNAGDRTVTITGLGMTLVDVNGKPVFGYPALGAPVNTAGRILPKELTLTGAQVNDKVYDGTRIATLVDDGAPALAGLVAGESLSLTLDRAQFDSVNAGLRTATVDVTLGNGSSNGRTWLASNYVLPLANRQTSATIHKATLTVKPNDDAKFVGLADQAGYASVRIEGFVGGESAATLAAADYTAPTLSRVVAGESAGTLANALQSSGGAATNYTFIHGTGHYTIVPADNLLVRLVPGTVTTAYGSTPGYAAVAQYLYGGAVAPTTVDIRFNGSLATVTDAGNNSASFSVLPVNGRYSGGQQLAVGSYALTATALSSTQNFGGVQLVGGLTVQPLALQLAVSGIQGRAYDGSTTLGAGSTPQLGVGNRVAGDVVSVTGNVLGYADKNAGANKAIALSGVGVSGADAGNYYLASWDGVSSASITPKVLAPIYSAGSTSKVYDGSTSATVSADLAGAGVVFGDTLTVSHTSAGYNSANVLQASRIEVAGIALAGADAGNYQLDVTTRANSNSQQFTAQITPRAVALDRFAAADKVYDGSTAAIGTDHGLSPVASSGQSGLVAGEQLGYAVDARFASPNAGSGIAVTATASLSDGINGLASNYRAVSTSSTASIQRRDITLALTPADKVYDGSTTAQVNGSFGNLVAGENLALADVVASFADRNAGSAKPVTISSYALADGSNGSLSNYNLVSTTTTASAASITPRLVTLVPNATKVYDGNTAYTVTATDLAGLSAQLGVAGDTVSAASISFADKNAGAGKTVNFSAATISDGNGGANYQVVLSGLQGGTIAQLPSVAWVGGASGNWFDPANWAGRAVPDLANVLQVQLPAGVQVSFDPAGATGGAVGNAPVQISALQGAGASLSQAAGQLALGSGGITLDTLAQAGGSLSSTGPIVLSTLTQSGSASLSGGALSAATLAQTGSANTVALTGALTVDGSFTQAVGATVQAQDASITVPGALALGNVSTSRDLSLTAGGTLDLGSTSVGRDLTVNAGGAVTQADAVTVGGNASVTSAGNITLDNEANNFVGAVSTSGQAITLADGGGGLTLGATSASGALTVTSSGGAITQAQPYGADNAIEAASTSQFTATSGGAPADVVLANPDNRFAGTVSLEAAQAVVSAASSIALGATQLTGALSLASGGDVTQTAALTLAGDLSVTAAGRITLDNAANALAGSVAVGSGGDTTLAAGAGGLTLGASQVGANLTVLSGGSVGQSAALTVAGTTSVTSAGNITLDNEANNFVGAVSTSGQAITLADGSGGLTLGATSASGALTVTSSGGAITQAQPYGADNAIQAASTSQFIAADGASPANIVLANPYNTFAGPVSVNGAQVAVSAAGDLGLGAVTITGGLAIVATGDVTQSAALTVPGTTSVVAGGNITLDNAANDFVGAVSTGGQAITLADGGGGLTLGATSASGALTVTSSGGAITQAQPYGADNAIEAASTSQFTATSGGAPADVVLANPVNTFGGPVSISGADISIVSGQGDLVLDIINATGDLIVAAYGTPGNVSQTSTGLLNAGGTTSIVSNRGKVTVLDQTPSNNAISAFSTMLGLEVQSKIANINNTMSSGGLTKPPLQQGQPDGTVSVVKTASSTDSSLASSSGVSTATSATGSSSAGVETSAQIQTSILVSTVRAVNTEGLGMVRVEVPPDFKGELRFRLPVEDRAALIEGGKPFAVDLDEKPLPAWLQFNGEQVEFSSASVPKGALPITVKVISGNRRTIVVIEQLGDKAD